MMCGVSGDQLAVERGASVQIPANQVGKPGTGTGPVLGPLCSGTASFRRDPANLIAAIPLRNSKRRQSVASGALQVRARPAIRAAPVDDHVREVVV
jgi:hypothetical protein